MNQGNIFLRQEPPPLVRVSAESVSPTSDTNPFILTVVIGNISVCRGYRQRYKKPAVPPLDLCIRHKEWQEFIDTLNNGLAMCITIAMCPVSWLVAQHFLIKIYRLIQR